MRLCLTAALVAALFANVPAHAENIADRWNLADVYPSADAWKADAAKLEAQFKEFDGCKGHIAENAQRLQQCLDLQADMGKRLGRLDLYASQLLSEDTGVASSLELEQRLELLRNGYGEATSFVNPELLHAGAQRIAALRKQRPGLAVYGFELDSILRQAPHTLDAKSEALIAQYGLIHGTGAGVYGILTNADIPWPHVKLSTGEDVTLDASAYTKYREAPARADRKLVMDTFFDTFKTYERTLGLTLYSQLKEDHVDATVHKYPDSLSAALDAYDTPPAVIDTLIAQTNANLPTLQRYFKLRARMLNIPDLHYYDMYPPLVHGDFKYTLEQAKQLTLDAVAPLGTDYVAALHKGFESRWMDAYPRPHKESGAHETGSAYDVHPYVLLNFNGDYDSVTTLAHEWGHAMHSYLANGAQPFVNSNYAIFTAEIASTFNESLLLDHMLKIAKTDDERLYYLGTALEELRTTFFRQAMFAEFERTIHAQADKGEPVTGESLSKTYCEILKHYHGDVVTIDPSDCDEWAYIPHFYTSFYVYQYATSIAASSLFAQEVGSGDKVVLGRYLNMLKSGGSDYPYQLVKRAGVDLATPAPYQALVARMNRIMDEMESIIAKKH